MERFTSRWRTGDGTGARTMLDRPPDLLDRAPKSMVNQATNTGRIEAVQFAIDLGFDLDFMDGVAALHNAAGGDKEGIVQLLLERGASLSAP